MSSRINNVVRVPTSIQGNFFKYWVDFLNPYHKLTEKESEVFASFLQERYNLSKKVSDPAILDKLSLDIDVKDKIKEKFGITSTHLQVLISKFKKAGVIKDNKIHPKFIPNVKEEKGTFQLLFLFELM